MQYSFDVGVLFGLCQYDVMVPVNEVKYINKAGNIVHDCAV